jgi:hypothetical protein
MMGSTELRTGGDVALAKEADHGLAALLEYPGGVHCGMRVCGVLSAECPAIVL